MQPPSTASTETEPLAPVDTSTDSRFWWPIVQMSALYLLIQSTRFFVDVGEDGIHYYAARLVAEGHAPYRDFFYGSAPGPALTIGALLRVGAPVWLTKLVPLGGAIATAALTALVARPFVSRQAAILAAAMVLFSDLCLRQGAYQGGHWVAAAMVMSAVAAGSRGRWKVAGALFSAASLYDLHAPVGLVVLLPMAWATNNLRQFLTGLAGLVAGWGLLSLWCGPELFEQTVVYALTDAPGDRARPVGGRLARLLAKESAIISLALAALLSRARLPRLMGVFGIATLLVVLVWPRAPSPVIALSLMGLAAGIGAHTLVQMGEARSRRGRMVAKLVVATLALCTLVPHVLTGMARHRGKKIANERIFRFSRMVKTRLPRSKRVWGDSAVVPTVAFRAGLRIPGNEFDTNDKRLRAGFTSPEKLIDNALSEGPPAVILVARHGIWLNEDVRSMAWRAMRLDFVFRGGVGYQAQVFIPPRDYHYFLRLGKGELFDDSPGYVPRFVAKQWRAEDRKRKRRGDVPAQLAQPATKATAPRSAQPQ